MLLRVFMLRKDLTMADIYQAFWTRIDKPGNDACTLESDGQGWVLHGTAVYRDHDVVQTLQYRVDCDRNWEAQRGHIHHLAGPVVHEYIMARDGRSWQLNGDAIPSVDGLLDLDLSFTPATNYLQLRRLNLAQAEKVDAPAVWFNVDRLSLSRLNQVYERRGDRTVWYEAPDEGYSALLELDDTGFIRHYPHLWRSS